MNKSLVTSVVAAAGLAVSGFSFAAAPAAHAGHWYAGLGLNHYAGQTETTNTDFKLDNSNIGYNVFVGNQLTKMMSVEAGFNYFGDRKYDFTMPDYNSGHNYWRYVNTYSVYLDALARLPLGYGFSVFAKGGANYFHGDIKDCSNAEDTQKLRTFALNYGAGLQYDWQQFGVRASYTQLKFSDNARFPTYGTTGVTYGEPSFLGLDFLYHFS